MLFSQEKEDHREMGAVESRQTTHAKHTIIKHKRKGIKVHSSKVQNNIVSVKLIMAQAHPEALLSDIPDYDPLNQDAVMQM